MIYIPGVSRARFAGPTTDVETIWYFHEELSQSGEILVMFAAFDAQLHKHGMMALEGQSVDASLLVPVPVRRTTKQERQTLSLGELPEE